MKRFETILKLVACAVFMLIVIGIFCYKDISPVDAVSGVTSKPEGLQEGGALTYFLEGKGR